jgi:hypothetical protein
MSVASSTDASQTTTAWGAASGSERECATEGTQTHARGAGERCRGAPALRLKSCNVSGAAAAAPRPGIMRKEGPAECGPEAGLTALPHLKGLNLHDGRAPLDGLQVCPPPPTPLLLGSPESDSGLWRLQSNALRSNAPWSNGLWSNARRAQDYVAQQQQQQRQSKAPSPSPSIETLMELQARAAPALCPAPSLCACTGSGPCHRRRLRALACYVHWRAEYTGLVPVNYAKITSNAWVPLQRILDEQYKKLVQQGAVGFSSPGSLRPERFRGINSPATAEMRRLTMESALAGQVYSRARARARPPPPRPRAPAPCAPAAQRPGPDARVTEPPALRTQAGDDFSGPPREGASSAVERPPNPDPTKWSPAAAAAAAAGSPAPQSVRMGNSPPKHGAPPPSY